MSTQEAQIKTRTRRHAFALAGALAVTVLTGGAAILGLLHKPPSVANIAQPVAASPIASSPAPRSGWNDD